MTGNTNEEEEKINRMHKHVNFDENSLTSAQCAANPWCCPCGEQRAGDTSLSSLQPSRPSSPQTFRPSSPRGEPPPHPPRSHHSHHSHRTTTNMLLSPEPPRYSTHSYSAYPSLVDEQHVKSAETQEWEPGYRHRQAEAERSCMCRRCGSRSLSPTSRYAAHRRRSHDVVVLDCATMTFNSSQAQCSAQRTPAPGACVDVQRADVPMRSLPSTDSDLTDRSHSIRERPSYKCRHVRICQEEPERDMHKDSYDRGLSCSYKEPIGIVKGHADHVAAMQRRPQYPFTSPEVTAQLDWRSRDCRYCWPSAKTEPIPFGHPQPASRYHRRCLFPAADVFGLMKTSVTTCNAPRPWCPVTSGNNVYFKLPKPDARRPRRVLSSERNIEMFINKEEVEVMVRRNRYY